MILPLIKQNLLLIEQGREILQALPDGIYIRSNEETYGASLGGHFRHIIQHYEAFLRDLPGGIINYDRRDRTSSVETDRVDADVALRQIAGELETLSAEDREIIIIQNHNPAEPERGVRSTLSRELTFLVSHTVHHFALVAVAMHLNGRATPRYFGYAPSTIYYLESQVQHATLTS